ncbi:hypothetical protein Mnod_7490 [Methylobacterium nodulans ORS 2060]|uniref:Uncharacterized protein n=1 Tax=Methylobacterium nodulans (strain LMG 21967 / CNCM I-2342 / ORS 2060) TaxID=460265 RepID=B8IPD5_METNO|nr:hypothetical protein Mnod_7490 [Methylobacterium nodulans ORS 2060]
MKASDAEDNVRSLRVAFQFTYPSQPAALCSEVLMDEHGCTQLHM